MKRHWLAATVLLATPGAVIAKDIPLPPSAVAGLSGEAMTYVIRDKSGFSITTPGKAAFGALGALAMIAEGNKILAAFDFADPSTDLSAALARALSAQYGLSLVDSVHVAGKMNPTAISTSAGGARYVLDVATYYWGYSYYPTDWTHYRVEYRARARLYDVNSKANIALGDCVAPTDAKDQAPTQDELLGNNGELMRQKLAAAGKACLEQFKAKVFLLTPSADEAPSPPSQPVPTVQSDLAATSGITQ